MFNLNSVKPLTKLKKLKDGFKNFMNNFNVYFMELLLGRGPLMKMGLEEWLKQ
jgi:hypothetical protein